MISRQTIIAGYGITAVTFTSLLEALPEKTQIDLNIRKGTHFFKPYQVNIIINEFGDYETGKFILKKNFARYYGLNCEKFRQELINEFGKTHYLVLLKRTLLSPKDQEVIIEKFGRW